MRDKIPDDGALLVLQGYRWLRRLVGPLISERDEVSHSLSPQESELVVKLKGKKKKPLRFKMTISKVELPRRSKGQLWGKDYLPAVLLCNSLCKQFWWNKLTLRCSLTLPAA